MISASVVIAAILHVFNLGEARATEVAIPIAAKATTREEAMLLVATQQGESTFRKSIEQCHCGPKECDRGKDGTPQAFGAYQLHRQHLHGHARAEVCRDAAMQAELAIGALSNGPTIRVRIAAFMGRKTNDVEVSKRVHLFDKLMKETEPHG